jgi:hypothetical protein
VYGNAEVAEFIRDRFIPVGLHVKRQPEEFRRVGELLGVEGAATAVIVGPDGAELLRTEGFVPPEEFIHLLSHGLEHHHAME